MTMEVIKFGADWCGPCQMYDPTFERVSNMDEFDNIEFKKLIIYQDKRGAKAFLTTLYLQNPVDFCLFRDYNSAG